MKKIILAIAVVGLSSAAFAAEPGQSGYYSGLQAGFANSHLKISDEDFTIDGLSLNGVVGGVFLGTRADISEQAFWGLEVNAQLNGNQFKETTADSKETIKNEYGFGGHVVAGIHASSSTRIYAKAGYQKSKFKASYKDNNGSESGSAKLDGFSYGGGGEVALSNEFSLRMDWTQIHYSSKNGLKPTDTVVQVGVVYNY